MDMIWCRQMRVFIRQGLFYGRDVMLMRLFLRIVVLWSCVSLAGCAANRLSDHGGKAVDRVQGTQLRVLSYNIRIGRGMDNVADLKRTAEVIRRLNPDLVALQEVDMKTNRSSGVDQAAELGKLTGMQAFFCKALDLPGGQYGEAVLSRLPVEDTTCYPLPNSKDRESRSALEVRVRLSGEGTGTDGPRCRTICFIGTHLDHLKDPTDRIRQTAALAHLATPGDAVPVILAGDFNDQPGTAALVSLGGNWLDTTMADPRPTFPSDKPDIRIDYVFARPVNRWRLISASVIEEPIASDHRPVLAVLELLP